jgi:hypothetical protein
MIVGLEKVKFIKMEYDVPIPINKSKIQISILFIKKLRLIYIKKYSSI